MDTVRPKRASDMELVLELNNMLQQDKKAYAKYPDLKELVRSIIGLDRGSVMPASTAQQLAEIRQMHEKSDEMTYLVPFITKLIADTRMVKPTEIADHIEASQQWIARPWTEEMLRPAYQQGFKIETLPTLETSNKVHREMLKDFPRVTKPIPDLLFGLFRQAFTSSERLTNSGHYGCVEVSDQSAHSFFLIECKTQSPLADAINQACRGGAALVNARRYFNALAEPKPSTSEPAGTAPQPPFEPYADLKSIAFSMELDLRVAWIYVHWAEVQVDKPVRYHMNMVASHGLADDEGEVFLPLRRHVDNILDWGTLKRKREIQETIKKIQQKDIENADKESSLKESETGVSGQPSAKRPRSGH